MRRCLAGQETAAAELVDRYQRLLFNVALRMLGNVQDAQDVTQTVFGNVFASLETYDPTYRFFSWIYRMTVNESLNAIKQRKAMVSLDGEMDLPSAPAVDEQAKDAEERLGKALLGLKPDDRSVVVLKHISGLSYEEIGEVLHLPVKTVKSRLFTARERLRLVLVAQGVE